jgi:flagellar biogenesis protein FliO
MNWIERWFPAGAWSRPGKRPRLEHLDRLALAPQHSLHLVRVGSRELLVGRSPGGVILLDSRETGAPVEEAHR